MLISSTSKRYSWRLDVVPDQARITSSSRPISDSTGQGRSTGKVDFVRGIPILIVKEPGNAEFRLQLAKASLRSLRKRLWLGRYQGSARPGSDGVAKIVNAPVEEGAVPSGVGSSLLGCTGCNNVMLLCGQHGQIQALLDGLAACCIAIQAVCNEGRELVCSFSRSGKNAHGHVTFAPVDGLVPVSSCLASGVVGSCIARVGPLAI